MTSRTLIRMLTGRRFNCIIVRQRGSHVIVQCGECRTVVPMHSRDLERHPAVACTMPWGEVVGMTKRRFKVVVRRDPEDSKVWLVNVAGEPRAHTFGRSLAEAKRHGNEVVALWFELEPDQFEIDWDIRLGELSKPVNQARAAIAHAEADRQRRDDAVRALTAAGMSYRDVAELLGLSHQRVAQIARAS